MKLTGIITLLVCISLVYPVSIAAQYTKIIGLKQQVAHSQSNQEKLASILKLCVEWRDLPADSVWAFAVEAEKLANYLHNEYALWYSKYYRNISRLKKASYDSIIVECDSATQWLANQPATYQPLEADFWLLKANVFIRTNRYKEANKELFHLLTKAEKLADTLLQIKTLSNLGWVQMEMEQYREALVFFHKAMALSPDKTLYDKYGILFSNTASTYNNVGNYDSAYFFAKQSIDIARKTQSLSNLCNALNIEADIFLNKGDVIKAGQVLDEAIGIRRQIGDPFYTISDMAQLALFYAHNGMQAKGIALSREAIALVDSFHLYAKLPFVYNGLAENYKTLGNYKEYSQTLEKLAGIKDSVYLLNKAEALAGLQARYDLQKKETTIMEQKVTLAKRNNLIAVTIALMIVVALSAMLFYIVYGNRQTRKMNELKHQQLEATLKAVNEAEEIQLRRIAAELHDNIGAQISYISSNVNWILEPPVPLSVAEQTERLNSVNLTSQNVMRNMRETLWALTSNRIKLDEFADKLKLHIQASIKFKTHLTFQSTESIAESLVELQPMQALNLYRIFQEAANNSIKYGEAKRIQLTVHSKESQFYIELMDNGIGFDTTAVNGEHYGLINMRYRAAESKFELTINSVPGTGTAISISGSSA